MANPMRHQECLTFIKARKASKNASQESEVYSSTKELVMDLKTTTVSKINFSLSIAVLSFVLSGCSLFSDVTPPVKDPKVYAISFRQLPPEPVYNRIKMVHLPDIKPATKVSASDGIMLDPLVKLSLRNSTLEQAAIALSALGNYAPYTASTVAKQKVNLEAYGTIDQLALELASKTGAHVVVDHPNRQIRILEKSSGNSSEDNNLEVSSAAGNSAAGNSAEVNVGEVGNIKVDVTKQTKPAFLEDKSPQVYVK